MNKVYLVQGACDTDLQGMLFAVCSSRERAERAKEMTLDGQADDDLVINEIELDEIEIDHKTIHIR